MFVFKIEKELANDHAKSALEKRIKAYLQDPSGEKVVESSIEVYLKGKPDAFDKRFKDKLEEEEANIVAYSHSVVFSLSDDHKSTTLRYAKPDHTKGQVKCTAVYPEENLQNVVRLTLNNQTSPKRVIVPGVDLDGRKDENVDQRRVGKASLDLSPRNSDLFLPGTVLDENRALDQSIIVDVTDRPKFSGAIWVDCTINIFGHARFGG